MDEIARPTTGDAAFLEGGEMARRIRQQDWSATPLGPMARWPLPLRTLLDVMLGSNQPMFLAWGPERTLIYNDPYANVLAGKHPAALGRPFLDVWEEIRDDLLPIVERAYQGEPVQMDDITLLMERRGFPEETHFAFSYTPVRDETGAVAGFFCACQEITGQVLSERRLRESEARLRSVLDRMGEAFGLMDPEFRILAFNEAALRLETRPLEEIVGRVHWEVYPGSEQSEIGRLYKRALAEEKPVFLEHRYTWENGTARWLEMRAFPVPEGLAVFWRDISDRKEAETELRESEARFRLMADAVPQIVWITDPEGRAEFFNKQWFDYTGASHQPATAADVAAHFVHPGDAEATMVAFDEARRTGGAFLVEHRIRSKAGEYRWFLARGEPYRDLYTGEVARWFGASVDIHDRRQAEAALRESEARLRFLSGLDDALRAASSAPEAMRDATEILARHLGASRCAYADVDADGTRFVIRSDYSAPGLGSSVGTYDLGLFGSRAASDMRSGRTLVVRDVRGELAPDDGREMFLSIGISAIVCCPLVKEGRLVAMMAVHQNSPRDWRQDEIALVEAVVERCWAHIERVGAEARLRESEAKFQAIANSIDQMVWSTRPDGFHDYYNQRWYEYTGVPPGSTDGEAWKGMFHPEDQDRAWTLWRRSLETGEPYHIEYRLRHGSGQYRWVLGRAQPLRDGSGRITRWFGTCTDIQDIVEAREVLDRSRTELERLIEERTAERDRMWETSPDLMLVIDFAGVFRRVNPAWTSILGYAPEELVGHHVNEFVVPDDHRDTTDAYELAAAGGCPRIENRYRHKDGSLRWISWTAAPAGDLTYATGRDVTAEKERQAELEAAQEALRQSQKMEAVGQLTGGLAHDFNNLLAGASGSLELIGTRIAQGRIADVERYLIAAQGATKRAAALTHRLLAFSRRQTLDPKPTDVNALVTGMEELIRRTVGPQVALECVTGAGVWPVVVDPNQLENALLNLCLNARDAMPDGGRLTIETANRWLDERAARERDLSPGQYVSLCVSDNGTGMSPEDAAKAFDPFFTTKPIGVGTGLGLSMVYGFARQSDGQARIYSELGQGTMVCLYLPRHLGDAEAAETQPEGADAVPGGSGETVLVIDDEPLVRMLVVDVLEELGYGVIEANDGPGGLKVLQSDARVDLLVTDVGLPGGMNGRQLADAARELRPGLKVVFITGYAENAALNHGHLGHGMSVVTKPFSVEELGRKVKAILSGH